jgi:plasmid stabilization system protein ParE
MKQFEIIWSNFAENELDEIFTYYSEVAGVSIAKNLLQNIIAEPNKLIANPKLGQCEELLLHRSTEYRYLLYKQFKLIYSVDFKMKRIKIADVFDSRQNPQKMKRTK